MERPRRLTIRVVDAAGKTLGWVPMFLCSRAEILPAPSDVRVEYGSIVILEDGKYLYARETPEQIAAA